MRKIIIFLVFLGLVKGFILPPKSDDATPWLRKVSYEEKLKHQQQAYESLQKAYSGINLENLRSKLRTMAGLPSKQQKNVNVIERNENGTYYIGGANIYEVNENAGISEYLFQGDVLMTEEQLDHLLPKPNSRQKRSMTSDLSRKWPKEGAKNFTMVPYKFEANYPLEWKPRVFAAIHFIQNNTCVRFRATKKSDKNFIQIINGTGCYSSIGMQGGKQTISLGSECMIPEKVNNFMKNNASDEITYGTPYEMDNIMHYGDREKQMENKGYSSDKCRKSKTKCLNGGMIDPNNCKKCICPEPMGNNTCNKLKDEVFRLTARDQWDIIPWQSGSPAEQTTNADIYPLQSFYHIYAPADKKIEFKVLLMKGFSYDVNCLGGGMEVKFRKDLRLGGAVFCPGRALPFTPIVSETNSMYLIIRSAHHYLMTHFQYKAV